MDKVKKNTPEEAAAVVKACLEGKPVERVSLVNGRTTTRQVDEHHFNFYDFHYRVKKEPRVVYVRETAAGVIYGNFAMSSPLHDEPCVKFIEVLDDA